MDEMGEALMNLNPGWVETQASYFPSVSNPDTVTEEETDAQR